MVEAAEAAGTANFLNFEFLCQPARLAMAGLLANGAIGTLEHLAFTAYTSGSRVPLRPWGWLFDRSRGGGWIGAFGSHAIDIIHTSVLYFIDPNGNERYLATPEVDHTSSGTAYEPANLVDAWANGIALVSRSLAR